jgi:hypothetical protein
VNPKLGMKSAGNRPGLLSETFRSLASGGATSAVRGYFVRVASTAMRWHVHVRGFVVDAVHARRPCSGSHLNRLFTSRLLLSAALRRPVAHFLVHFVRCVTGHAARDSAREDAMAAQMACDAARECASNAAFGEGEAWVECNREG